MKMPDLIGKWPGFALNVSSEQPNYTNQTNQPTKPMQLVYDFSRHAILTVSGELIAVLPQSVSTSQMLGIVDAIRRDSTREQEEAQAADTLCEDLSICISKVGMLKKAIEALRPASRHSETCTEQQYENAVRLAVVLGHALEAIHDSVPPIEEDNK
jgi:hypothetical protein